MSTTEYSNRKALDEALKFYLDAMSQFVISNLSEQLIKNDLPQLSGPDIRTGMEIKDIAFLIRKHWEFYFRKEFKIEDSYYRNRSYDARSVASLIVEGRNRVSHQRLKELDSRFTQIQLFLIAEILGEINALDAQREVETIRDKRFEDPMEEDGNAEHQSAIAKLNQSLASEKERSKNLSGQLLDNAVKLDEKKKDLEKLSKQLAVAELQVNEKEKQRKKLDRQVKNAKVGNDRLKRDLAGVKQRLEESEAARADYKERLETKLEELERVKTDLDVSEERLTAEANRFAALQTEKGSFEECFRSAWNLLTTAAIGDQLVFPPLGTDTSVRILDRRGTDKRNYLLELLEQKQSTVIYVQNEEKIDLLLTRVLPEKADVIGIHEAQTSEAQEMEILEKLASGELTAIVSSDTISTLQEIHRVEHFVFCHLTPDLDVFFKRCQPAFTSKKNAYMHLIYNSEQDIEGLDEWLTQKYPDRETLEKLYTELKKLAATNGDFVHSENVYDALDIAKLGIETGLAIFEELGLLEKNKDDIKLLPASGRKLDESKIYCSGEKLKQGIIEVQAFQLEQSIEKIWDEILKELKQKREQVVRESNIDKMLSKISEVEDSTQSIINTDQNKVTLPTVDVWPQRGMRAFKDLRQRASKNFTSTNTTMSAVNESSPKDIREFELSEVEKDVLRSPMFENRKNEKDYQRKYDLAMQFVQEYGGNPLEQGIAQLIEDQDDPDYNFTEDESNMLRAFRHALTDFRTQSEKSVAAIESERTVMEEAAEAKPTSKSTRANAKVNEEQVREIRTRHAAGESNSKLAKEFGLTPPAVRDIVRRNTWKHVE